MLSTTSSSTAAGPVAATASGSASASTSASTSTPASTSTSTNHTTSTNKASLSLSSSSSLSSNVATTILPFQPPSIIPPRRSSSIIHQQTSHSSHARRPSQPPPSEAAEATTATTIATAEATEARPTTAPILTTIPPTSAATVRQRNHHHHHHHSHEHDHPSSSSSSSGSTATATPSKGKGVLGPLSEGDWLASKARRPRKPSMTMASVKAGNTSAAPPPPPPPVVAIAAASIPAAQVPTAPIAPTASPDPMRYATEDFNFSTRHTWTEEKERIVCGPFDYLNGVKGKEFRTQLINAFNGWLQVPDDSLAVITRVVGMLHTASLLVDDVEDSSSLRRGLPVAHNIFGVPQTINSANYIYFMALQELQKLRNHEDALAIFAEELCNLHRGQGMDLFWRDTLTCPTEDDYLEMVGHKTGGLFRLGIKLMQAESTAVTTDRVDCVPLVNLLGLLFQIQDDYRNLRATEYSQNKGMCEDLTEGKFSFPVIHSIRHGQSPDDPANMLLLNILKQRPTDEEVKRYAVAHMERTGSFVYTRKVLAVLTQRARAMADALDEGKGRSQAVHAILDRLVIV